MTANEKSPLEILQKAFDCEHNANIKNQNNRKSYYCSSTFFDIWLRAFKGAKGFCKKVGIKEASQKNGYETIIVLEESSQPQEDGCK